MRYHHECTKSFKTDIICSIFTEYNSSIKRMNYDTFENIKNKCVRIREKSSMIPFIWNFRNLKTSL